MAKPDKRDEIVQAALELIAEHGFHGAPMAMIAERAGVGAGTIYLLFREQGRAHRLSSTGTSKRGCIRS